MSPWQTLLEALGVAEASSKASQLVDFERDVLRFAAARNLVSRRDPERELRAQIAESVHAACAASQLGGTRGADLGSGAGIPGLPWLILRGGALDLIERRQGRADFLERELRALRLQGSQVRAMDARDLAALADFEPYDWVLAKAVAETGPLLALVEPLLAPGGTVCVFGRPNSISEKDFQPEQWIHQELLLRPDPAGPAFAASALQLLRRVSPEI